MATINFLYRSKRELSYLSLRLLFRHKSKDHVFGAKTKFKVEKDFWEKKHKSSRLKDEVLLNKQAEINAELYKIRKYVLERFNTTPTDRINKEWLNEQVKAYYNPRLTLKEVPIDLIGFIDYFIEEKKKAQVKHASIVKFNVIKNKMRRMEKHFNTVYLIKDINSIFKDNFQDYYISESYSQNTMHREFNIIKTFCRFAASKGLEISPSLRDLKFTEGKVLNVYLNKEELQRIENLKDFPSHLENARDWLLISCWTGQRISDFMRFNSSMLGFDESSGHTTIQFVQEKTEKPMNMPLGSKVLKTLKKRNGEFPKKMSSQRYNDHIKTICQLAEINEQTEGNVQINISKDPNVKKIRHVRRIYAKYELICSKVGRKSFATNMYLKMPTSYIIYFTGHSTENILLKYISKSNKDLAIQGAKYLD